MGRGRKGEKTRKDEKRANGFRKTVLEERGKKGDGLNDPEEFS